MISRRKLLKGLFIGSAFVGTPYAINLFRKQNHKSNKEIIGLLEIVFNELNSFREIGVRYLYDNQNESDIEYLASAVFDDMDRQYSTRGGGILLLKHEIRRKVENDFQVSNIYEMDGWVISRTEARIGGLLALNSGQASL